MVCLINKIKYKQSKQIQIVIIKLLKKGLWVTSGGNSMSSTNN